MVRRKLFVCNAAGIGIDKFLKFRDALFKIFDSARSVFELPTKRVNQRL